MIRAPAAISVRERGHFASQFSLIFPLKPEYLYNTLQREIVVMESIFFLSLIHL